MSALGRPDIVGAKTEIGEYAVRRAARGLQRARMRRGEEHGRRPLDPRQMGGRSAQRCRFALQQRLDECHTVGELRRLRFGQPDVAGTAVPGANPERGAAVRDQVERGNRRSAHRRMPRQQIGDTDRNPRTLRGARHQRRGDPGIHGIPWGVGDADHGVAVAVGALGEPFTQIGRIGPEKEAYLHLDPAFDFLRVTRAAIARSAVQKRRYTAAIASISNRRIQIRQAAQDAERAPGG